MQGKLEYWLGNNLYIVHLCCITDTLVIMSNIISFAFTVPEVIASKPQQVDGTNVNKSQEAWRHEQKHEEQVSESWI